MISILVLNQSMTLIFQSLKNYQIFLDSIFCNFFEHYNICSGVCFEINFLHKGQIYSLVSVGFGLFIITITSLNPLLVFFAITHVS
jgi:hypothetical protein